MSPDTISRLFLQAFRNERSLLLMSGLVLLMYFFIMDIALYVSLQNTSLIDQPKPPSYSPFKPLTVKLLMTAPTNHYVISLTSEYFEEWTGFAKIFWFLTPNMVTFTHLFVGFASAKFATSESLRKRRIGVFLFEIRMWLDVYDGIVYRVRKQEVLYTSHRTSTGYYLDVVCDTAGGMAYCFGCLFFLWRTQPLRNTQTSEALLPRTKSEENGVGHLQMEKNTRSHRNVIFYKITSFGLLMALVGMTWDKTTEKGTIVFETKLDTTLQTDIQTEALHSFWTWVMFYMWRLFEGQALLQMILFFVFIDKLWEFLCAVQYIGYVILATINIYSLMYLHKVSESLKIS